MRTLGTFYMLVRLKEMLQLRKEVATKCTAALSELRHCHSIKCTVKSES